MLGGKAGYKVAHATLKDRFGDDLVISQAVISSLRDGSLVKSPSELRILADELVSSNLVLDRLGSLQEVQSQCFIAAVIDRLQPFIKGK